MTKYLVAIKEKDRCENPRIIDCVSSKTARQIYDSESTSFLTGQVIARCNKIMGKMTWINLSNVHNTVIRELLKEC